MVINGIDYCVAIYTTSADGYPEYEAHFADFQELNAFIRNNRHVSKYRDKDVCFSLVEVADGEPGAFSWTKPFEFIEFTDEQIQFEINDFIDFEKENEEFFAEVDAWSKEIHYRDTGKDYKKKHSQFDDFAYVCPHCIRIVEDCRCEMYPYYLVQIDRLMVPIVRELNAKGYMTTGCCAGHPSKEEFIHVGIYICFAEEYDFDTPFPEGGSYSKEKHCISYRPQTVDYDKLVEFQRDTLDKLSDWAEMLFDKNDFSWMDEEQG